MTSRTGSANSSLGLEDSNAPSACLSEDEVLAFAGGHLSSARRRDAHLHFDKCEICQRLLNEAVHALATAATHGSPDHGDVVWNTTFRAGTIVGQRYVIRRFIARGGMGEVFEAFDQELQERVALKTVNATASDDPGAVRRLKAEVQLARRVSHPSVCRIYDFGTHVDAKTGAQISFLTMEFIDGTTLGRQVRLGGAIPIEQTRAWARGLLLGLSAAHEAGVLHRDFKSDNVMLREEGRLLHAVILDFGLARALDQRSQHSSTNERGLIGTFAYIAPEQLEGHAHSIASDIYAFGVVWFEMLTGELPFGLTSSPAVTTLERLTRRAPAPSSKNPLVSTDLDSIVLGCLERSPSDRFKSAGEVLARLDLLESRLRAPPRGRARRALAVAVAATAVAVLAGGAQAWRWAAHDDAGAHDAGAHDAGAHDASAAFIGPASAPVVRVPAAAPAPSGSEASVVLRPEPRAPAVASSNQVAAPPLKERSHGSHPVGARAVAPPPPPETHEDRTAVEDSTARVHDDWENPFQPGK
jgi:hypothetical protein